jgi:hypothetical protein
MLLETQNLIKVITTFYLAKKKKKTGNKIYELSTFVLSKRLNITDRLKVRNLNKLFSPFVVVCVPIQAQYDFFP